VSVLHVDGRLACDDAFERMRYVCFNDEADA
jgi:hypothetical protein